MKLLCFFIPAEAKESDAEIHMGGWCSIVQCHRLSKLSFSFGIIPFSGERDAVVQSGLKVFWRKLGGFLQRLNRFVRLAEFQILYAQLAQSLRKVRIKSDRATELFGGLLAIIFSSRFKAFGVQILGGLWHFSECSISSDLTPF